MQGFYSARNVVPVQETSAVAPTPEFKSKFLGFRMQNALRNRFPPFRDERSLRAAIESVCGEFGELASLTILPAEKATHRQCTCLLRLNCSVAEAALRSKLDVADFGGDMLFFVEVADEWTGPTV
jgi:hypothetical protein